MTITQSTIWNELQASLEGILDDSLSDYRKKLDFPKWMEEKSMDSAYIDYQELGGPGYAAEVPETTAIPTGEIAEGYSKRFIARKFGRLLQISEEARDDCKYSEALELGRRNIRGLMKTADLDSAFILIRALDPAYLGADGVVLASAAHPLAQGGGVYSNILPAGIAPSVAAVAAARTMATRQLGHDGTLEGYNLEKVLFPVEQWEAWQVINGSSFDPIPGNFSAINIVKEMKLELVPIKHWINTATDYTFMTDADGEPVFLWRKKASTATWGEQGIQIMKHSVSARWDCGARDPRAFIYVHP